MHWNRQRTDTICRGQLPSAAVTRRSAYKGTTESGGLCNLFKSGSHRNPGPCDLPNNAIFRIYDAMAVHCSGRDRSLPEHAVMGGGHPLDLIPPRVLTC